MLESVNLFSFSLLSVIFKLFHTWSLTLIILLIYQVPDLSKLMMPTVLYSNLITLLYGASSIYIDLIKQINQLSFLFIINMSTLSEEFIQKAIHNSLENQKCWQLHPGQSCNVKMLLQFMATCKSLYKMYLFVHLIPFILFKRKKLKQRPIEEVRKLVVAFIKSMLFAGGYSLIVRRTHYKYSGKNAIFGALFGSLTLNFEPIGRQSQIALFCLNKAIQTSYHLAKRRNYPVTLPYGQCLLMGLAISIISYLFVDCPESIRQNYKKVLDKIIGNI